MTDKDIYSTRDIDLFLKIKTDYSKTHMMDYLKIKKLQEDIINDIQEVIPIELSIERIGERSTEKQIKEAKEIDYSEVDDINKYIYMKLIFRHNTDVNKEYNILIINYLHTIIDKHIVLMINGFKDKEIKKLKSIIERKKKGRR